MKMCTQCNQQKSFDLFCKNVRAKDGFQSACKQCMAVHYKRNRLAKLDHYRTVQDIKRQRNVQAVREWKESRGCLICKEKDYVCLDLHHLDPSVKEADPSKLASKSFSAFLKEAEKCVVLCSNCHRKVHANRKEALLVEQQTQRS